LLLLVRHGQTAPDQKGHLLGAGISGVDGLGITRVADAIRLQNRTIVPVGEDVLLAWDVVPGI
jgi:hypothetical protein